MDLSTDLLTDLPATVETTHIGHRTIHHTMLDHISEIKADTRTMKIDRTFAEITIETEDTNITTSTTREMDFRTGMTVAKTETCSTTEVDQTSTNTIRTNQKCKSSSNSQIRTY